MDKSGPVVAIIEDDAAQLQLLVAILERQRPTWRIRPITADQDWMDRVRADPASELQDVELSIVDYRLDPATALDLLPALCSQSAAVVMTGSLEGADQEACRQAGAAAVVPKPYTLDQVGGLLDSCDRLLEEALS